MVERDLLTTREVARLLGVGTTSVKRWADSGVLRCVKTPGGHRRFPRDSVDAFLVLSRRQGGVAREDLPGRGHAWLLKLSRTQRVSEIIRALRAELRDQGAWFLVADSMKLVLDEVGDAWARGDITEVQEHIISERFARAVSRLSESISVPRDAGACVLMAAEGDDHTLGLYLAELCLREAGWRATWVGRKTPVHSACEFIAANRVAMVAVSASAFSRDAASLADQAERLERACEHKGVPLLLGGMGRWPEQPRYARRLYTFSEMRSFLDQLADSHDRRAG